MNPIERINRTVNLQVPDRVPIAPEIWGDHASAVAGISFQDICTNMEKADYAMEILLRIYGELDMLYPLFKMRLPSKPYDLSHGHPQYVEEERADPKLYDELARRHYPKTYDPKREMTDFMVKMKSMRHYISKWEEQMGIPLYGGVVGVSPPAESFSMLRSLGGFSIDLFRNPQKIIMASDAVLGDLVESRMVMAKMAGVPRVFFGSGRTSASFISPTHYERFVLPYAKKIIQKLAQAGYVVQMHMDGNWTPLFEYFREFPKKKCILHLDGTSDMSKAKEVLGDRMCLMGDVFATTLAVSSPQATAKYCRQLIDICGEGGGFILSSGCTVPANAKIENVKAMIKTAKTHGIYRK